MAVQVLCLIVIYMIYLQIQKMPDGGKKLKIPEVKQMGQVVKPAIEQTPKEYDMDQLKEAVKQPLIGFVVIMGIYYKWGSLLPLVMQMLMTPMHLYEAPLAQIHLLGKTKTRPFPAPNPFGLPAAAPPAEEVEDAADKKKDK